MSGHTPWWKTRAKPIISTAIYNDRWGEDNHEFAGERMDDAERVTDLIIEALDQAGYAIRAEHWELH